VNIKIEKLKLHKKYNTANEQYILFESIHQPTMTLSCLFHVKRVANEDGNLLRPPAPALIVVEELLVDRSNSMTSLGASPTQGTLAFIAEQKRLVLETGAKVYFSLTTFDNTATTCIDNVRVGQVNPTPREMYAMISPRGATLLVDTMYARLCGLSSKVTSVVASLPREIRDLKPKVTVIFAVITDGKDNRSTLCSDADLNALITKKRGEGFAILFLAANQDAIQTAKRWNIDPDCAQTFGATATQTQACFRSASAAAARAVSGYAPAFTKRERQLTAPARPLWAQDPRALRAGGGGGARGCAGMLPPPRPQLQRAISLAIPVPAPAITPAAGAAQLPAAYK
jgi:hypothetical protein